MIEQANRVRQTVNTQKGNQASGQTDWNAEFAELPLGELPGHADTTNDETQRWRTARRRKTFDFPVGRFQLSRFDSNPSADGFVAA